MKRLLPAILICLVLSVSCTVQEAHLVYRPAPTEAPTAVPIVTPTPEPLSIPAVTGAPFLTDANGVPITDELTHYLTYYVSFQTVRVYEYEQSTFLDGTLVSTFSQPLTGQLRVSFRTPDGVLYGYGDLETADGSLVVLPGENRIYAEIHTEVDVQKMPFTVAAVNYFGPSE